MFDALCDLVPLVQSKKLEKHSWRSDAISKVASFSLQLTKSITSPWVFFHVFKMIQIVPNQAKRHTFSREVTIFPISNYGLDIVISVIILKSSLPFYTLASRNNEVLDNLIWFCDSVITGIKVWKKHRKKALLLS